MSIMVECTKVDFSKTTIISRLFHQNPYNTIIGCQNRLNRSNQPALTSLSLQLYFVSGVWILAAEIVDYSICGFGHFIFKAYNNLRKLNYFFINRFTIYEWYMDTALSTNDLVCKRFYPYYFNTLTNKNKSYRY